MAGGSSDTGAAPGGSAPVAPIDIRAGFRRAGSALFWLSAALVMMLWGAQKVQLIGIGAGLSPLAFVILLVGFAASSAARIVGLAISAAAGSSMAKEGARRVAGTVSQLGWLPRLFLGFLPGAKLLTLADILSAAHDGTFANGMRGLIQTIGAVTGGGIMGIGFAAAGWRWWSGTPVPALTGWLVLAGIGAVLMVLFFVAAGWVARGFKPRAI